jgi:hypothetical protein
MAEFYNKNQVTKSNGKDYQAFAIKDAEVYNKNNTYNEILKIVRKAFSIIKFNDLIK